MLEKLSHTSKGAAASGQTTADEPPPPLAGEPVAWRWFWIGIGLVVAVFAPTLVRLVGAWSSNDEYSHGFLMPLVALWLLRERRDEIRSLRGGTSVLAIPCWSGVCS